MKQKLRSVLFAALALTATTLFGGYLDTNTWSSDDRGSWDYDSASGRLTCVLNEDCNDSTCEISVPGRGWLTFNWRIVSAANESRVLNGYDWVDKVNSSCGVRADEYGSSGWKTMRLPVREIDGGIASVVFSDDWDMNGKVQIAEISFEAAGETPVTVKFELCGGMFENGESTTMVCTNQYASLPEPVRENCMFLGWTEEDGASIYSETVSDGTALPLGQKTVTLHALWDVPAEEAIDPTGALRDDERGNWIEFGSSISIQDVSATWMSKARQNESGGFESVMEWAGEYVSISVENDGSDEIDLLTLYVHGCGTLDFTSVNAYLYGNNSNAELALLIDGEEVKVLSDGASSKRLDGQYDICRLAGYYAIEEGVGTGDSDYDLHQIRVVARPKDTSSYGFEFVLLPIRWTEASGKQTVTFDARGGSAAGTKTYSIGSAYGSLPQPSRSGATFQGWFTKPDGGEQVVASEFVRPSVTNLYARWTASLSTALGGSLTFRGANNAWIGTADVSRQNDGSWSATTDNVQYGVTNVMSTTVTGRGIISFWWMRGMEPWYLTYDFLPPLSSLSLWVDGKQVAECNSAKDCLDWRHLSYAIEKVGTHKVEWRYTPGGSREDAWDADAIANAVVSFDENLEEMRELYKSIGAEFPISSDRVYAPGAWVQDVRWTPAGEVNDFVTWARGPAEGRSWLTDELPTIETYYTKKIKSDSRDYESVLLRALTKIAQLGENANLLAVLKKFGYTPDYQNLGTFSGNLSYGSAPLSNAVVDSVAKESIPVLESALADLNLIPDSWNGSVMLSPDVYPVDETTFVDLADVTFARAVVKGALASLAVAQSYDLSLDYAKIETHIVAHDGKKIHPTFKQIVNDHPSFLKSVRSKSRLTEGKKLLREALETTQTADRLMLARSSDELHFFEYDAEDEEEIQFARDEIAKGLKALDSTVVLTDDDFAYCRNYRFENLRQSVALSPFFAGKLTRAHLGTAFNEKGWPVLDSFPDITFGSILPGLTKTTVAKWLAAYGIDVDGSDPADVDPDPEEPDPAEPEEPDPVEPEEPDEPDYSWNWLCEDIGDVADLSSAQIYNGCLYDEDGGIAGSIQVKAGKATTNRKTGEMVSKVTVSVQVVGEAKKVSASGMLNVEDGSLALTTKDGRELEFEIGSNGILGMFDGYELDGVRDLFSSRDKEEQTSVNDVVNELKEQGAVVIVWEDEETFGYNVLSVTVAAKGKAKVSGTLANGTKVSATAQMIVGETMCCIPVSYSKKGVELSFGVWIERDGLAMDVTGLGEDVVVGFASGLEDGDGWTFYLDVDGLAELLGDDTYLDLWPDGVGLEVSGTKWTLPKAGKVVVDSDGEIDWDKAGDNPSGLKLTYKAKDGTFTGSFKAYADVNGKPKATSVTVSGIVVDGIGYGTAKVGKLGAVSASIE